MLLYLIAYWLVVTISLTNTVLLLWLGLTILFNTERRSWGVWLIGFGLLTGGLFFISHTVILVLNLTTLGGTIDLWWHLGLGAALALPFAWYTAMLWYSGFWEAADSPLRRRHRLPFALNVGVVLALGGLLLFANPFPSFSQALRLEVAPTPILLGIPLLVIVYPPAVLLSIGLSVDVLLHPGPARRMMGDIARRRAQPWLIATSVVLLLAGGMVGWVMFQVVRSAAFRRWSYGDIDSVIRIANADLVIASLITLAVLCLGQAVARYEVFTGKTLPQQRFMRHWRNGVLLAFGFGGVMSACVILNLPQIYTVLLTALLLTVFYALFSRRSYVERERYIAHLRPFLTSERIYEHMTHGASGALPTAFDITMPFYALCDEILGASSAYLLPVGAFAPLIGGSVAYPAHRKPPPLGDLIARFDTPQTMVVQLDPAQHGGVICAIPLWSERGLVGVLLLGEKRTGSLYTQEEIEIARASGERLIDTQASAEMSRRLMGLQRQRMAQSQVVDRRTRRMLHDDVLPRLHAAMLELAAGSPPDSVVDQLAALHRQLADLLHETAPAPEIGQLGLIPALKQALDDELGGAFDGVTWQVDPAAQAEAERLPPLSVEVVYYAAREAMRNAAVYGRGDDRRRPLNLRVEVVQHNGLALIIEDDGVGVASANDTHGSGHGLALHGTMMAVIGGALEVESAPGRFTRVTLALPTEAKPA